MLLKFNDAGVPDKFYPIWFFSSTLKLLIKVKMEKQC